VVVVVVVSVDVVVVVGKNADADAEENVKGVVEPANVDVDEKVSMIGYYSVVLTTFKLTVV
jgi:hypothetical protein